MRRGTWGRGMEANEKSGVGDVGRRFVKRGVNNDSKTNGRKIIRGNFGM